ncbi:MAG: BON domain-containing protein [Candidatus Acidiferrales bacterium]
MSKFTRSFLSFTFLCSFLFATLVAGSAWARGAPSSPAASPLSPAQETNPPQSQRNYNTEVALIKEVRHVLVMQPFYTVFDNLAFKVEGEKVTLMGQVVRPALKSDAASSVKHIEGVTSVDNQIKVLPPSTSDNRIRLALYRAIYSAPGFEKYEIQAVPPIHIIVDFGHVTLTGVVADQMDKTVAVMRAKQVPGTFEVKDELRVDNPGK